MFHLSLTFSASPLSFLLSPSSVFVCEEANSSRGAMSDHMHFKDAKNSLYFLRSSTKVNKLKLQREGTINIVEDIKNEEAKSHVHSAGPPWKQVCYVGDGTCFTAAMGGSYEGRSCCRGDDPPEPCG